MARKPRVVVQGMPHHITHRGSRRSDVFRDDADRLMFLEILRDSCKTFHLSIWSYCLMTNHCHFVAVPDQEDSIRKVFHRTDGMYSKRFNTKYEFVGHLWQERPFSCVLSGPHVLNAIRYVELNPVRAGIVARAQDYRWSSARSHCTGVADPLLYCDGTPVADISNWASWLAESNAVESDRLIRERTNAGAPCGDDDFVRSIAASTGRDFTRRKPGPKPRGAPARNLPLPWSDDD